MKGQYDKPFYISADVYNHFSKEDKQRFLIAMLKDVIRKLKHQYKEVKVTEVETPFVVKDPTNAHILKVLPLIRFNYKEKDKKSKENAANQGENATVKPQNE